MGEGKKIVAAGHELSNHSSLSSFGWVSGRAILVIQALMEVVMTGKVDEMFLTAISS